MGRFLPPPAFREEYGCIRSSSAASGSCVTLGKKLKAEQPMDSQFCEDKILESTVGSHDLVVGVFDGHGGHQCSRVASAHLLHTVSQLVRSKHGLNSESIVSAFKAVDERWCSSSDSDDSGTTATVSVITRNTLTVAHVGDSRVIKIERDGTCQALTKAHRAGDIVERELVLSRGGHIPEFSQGECARVNGIIEVTRSLGDRSLKPVLDCTPDVVTQQLTDEDAFLVMGSDGIFDRVEDDALARAVSREAEKGASADDIAFSLAKLAFRNGSEDDISVHVLDIQRHRRLSHCTLLELQDRIPAVHEPAQHDSQAIHEPVSVPGEASDADATSQQQASETAEDESPLGRDLAWRSLQWGACALALTGAVLLACRWHW